MGFGLWGLHGRNARAVPGWQQVIWQVRAFSGISSRKGFGPVESVGDLRMREVPLA